MWVFDGADGVDGHAERAVGAVFEAYGEGEARCKFAMELRLGCACTYRT